MAITKYDFINTSGADNSQELYDWLSKNAVEFFDSITIDDSSNVVCSLNNGGKIEFSFSMLSLRLTLAGGGTATGSTNIPVTQAYKTNNGIMLFNNRLMSTVITKSNEGNTFIFANYSSNGSSLFWADLMKSPSVQNGSIAVFSTSAAQSLTTLTPVVAAGGVYSPNLFFTYFSEYPSVKAVISMGGKEYVYSGKIALAD